MSRRFGGASTQLTSRLVWPPPFRKTVGGPEAVLNGEPGEEATLGGSPSFPNNFPEGAWQRGQELGLVGGAGRVTTIG
jgi:hypothetical protein